MNKLLINIITDSTLKNTLNFEEGKLPAKIEYTVGQNDFDGITVFTDKVFDKEHIHIIDIINSKYKLAWMHEPRVLGDWCNNRYLNLEARLDSFDKIMTYDEHLLDSYPEKTIFCADNGIWIKDENIKLHDKTKMVSLIYSWKKTTEGHKLRHALAKLGDAAGFDLYGDGSPHPVEFKEEALVDYQFSITIENSRSKYYFTEKLLDCFAVGTIPIYWGCTNVEDFFDERGILQFKNIEELRDIFIKISEEPSLYNLMYPFIKINYQKCLAFKRYEDWIFDNIYSKILKGEI